MSSRRVEIRAPTRARGGGFLTWAESRMASDSFRRAKLPPEDVERKRRTSSRPILNDGALMVGDKLGYDDSARHKGYAWPVRNALGGPKISSTCIIETESECV